HAAFGAHASFGAHAAFAAFGAHAATLMSPAGGSTAKCRSKSNRIHPQETSAGRRGPLCPACYGNPAARPTTGRQPHRGCLAAATHHALPHRGCLAAAAHRTLPHLRNAELRPLCAPPRLATCPHDR